MKKILSIILALILCAAVLAGCNTQKETVSKDNETKTVSPLPETLDINSLDNCTVAVSLEKGGAFLDDNGKKMMEVTVYSYDLYDMVDISELKENDIIVRKDEEVTVTEIERLESGLVRINGGEENGGFDLISNEETVYYEVGMNDIKAYCELGKVKLPVSDEFECVDSSDIEAEEKTYSFEEVLKKELEYNFTPNNASVVIENGIVTKMNKVYMP